MRRSVGVAALLALAACTRLSDADAVAVVRRYNDRLAQAYRAGDQRLVEGLVGDNEAKKILGLIGAKLDMGITLDAELTDFEVLGVERPEGVVEVLTEERWTYRDRRIGSGDTVGEPSADHYFMRYTLGRAADRWLVTRVRFEREPEVGRSVAPNRARPEDFHGMTGADPARSGP